MARRTGQRRVAKEEAPKTFAEQAADIGDWLENLQKAPALIRGFRLWWHRHTILEYALAGCDEALDVANATKKIRKAIGVAVMALGGPQIDWQKQAVKKDGDKDD